MKNYSKIMLISAALSCSFTWSQTTRETTINSIMTETYNDSQLERLAYELLDGIGPRLVGSPKMQQSHDWAVNQFKKWGIEARNEQWGEWKSWERGTSNIEMVYPYAKSLEGMQLAFSPATPSKGVTADVVMLPEFSSKEEFNSWLPKVKGKLVMVSQYQPSGRPDYNWKEFATPESYEKMRKEASTASERWQNSMKIIGETSRTMNKKLEDAGAEDGLLDAHPDVQIDNDRKPRRK